MDMDRKSRILVFVALFALVMSVGLVAHGLTAADAVTLEFWSGFSGDDRDAMGKLVDQFNRSQDEIKINWTTYQWDQLNSKLITGAAIGNVPDVVAMWATVVPEMVSKGVLSDLGKLATAAGIEKSDFLPEAWKLGNIKGRQYGVPLDLHNLALFVNLDHLKAAGLKVEDLKPGKDNFVAVAKKLTVDTNGDGTPDQWGFGILPSTQWPIRYWMALIVQQGGSMFTSNLKKAAFNSAKGREAMQFLADLIHKYKVSPANLADLNQGFLSGKVSMIINGPWFINSALRQQNLNFTIVKFPQIYNKPATWGQSHQLVLPKQKDVNRQKAAMKFIKFLTDNGVAWAAGGQAPAKISVINDPKFQSMKLWHPFVESQKYTVLNPPILPQTKIFAHDPATPLVAAWEAVVQGRMTVQEALTQAEKRVNEILAAEG